MSLENTQAPSGSQIMGQSQLSDEKNYSVVKLESAKQVTEKMVFNLLTKTKSATPIMTRVVNSEKEKKTTSDVVLKKLAKSLQIVYAAH